MIVWKNHHKILCPLKAVCQETGMYGLEDKAREIVKKVIFVSLT